MRRSLFRIKGGIMFQAKNAVSGFARSRQKDAVKYIILIALPLF